MLKEVLKSYLEQFIEAEKEMYESPYSKVPYNEDEPSDLYVGEIDEDGWIGWQYAPADRVIDFSGLEKEYNIHIPEELKEYYNSYYFLSLDGFWEDGLNISLDEIDKTTDVLGNLRDALDDEAHGQMVPIGEDGYNRSICVKIDSGQVIAYDWEFELNDLDPEDAGELQEETVLADSLSEFFSKLKPEEEGGEYESEWEDEFE